MSKAWSAPVALSLDVVSSVQRGLSVGMIMTPRKQIMTCLKTDSVAAIMEQNSERYSFIPVVSETGRYLGLFDASRWFDEKAPCHAVAKEYQPLSEDHVIGSDASIFDFVVSADDRPMRLVVSGSEIAGVISLSDLQQLPVRAALFTLITALEIVMARRIELEWPDDSAAWMGLISSDRRARIVAKIREVRHADGYVSDIALSQFADKATIIRRAGLIDGSTKSIKRSFGAAEELRNNIAHSNYYAETPEHAKNVCEVVRNILQVKSELLAGIESKELAGGAMK